MPKIGVFWCYKDVVFGRAVSLDKAEDLGIGILDSPDTHTDLWDKDRTLLRDFPEQHGGEYFSIPRGRVLWELKTSSAKIFMDSVLFRDTSKQKILETIEVEKNEIP